MIYFSDFASSAASDVTIAVQRFETGTTTGTQTFSNASLGSVTPKAALLLGTRDGITAGPSTTSASWGIGASDASNDVSAASRSTAGSATTSGRTGFSNVSSLFVNETTSATMKAASAAMVSGGLELDFSANATVSVPCGYIAFAGSDVTAVAFRVNLGTGTSALAESIGFQPDVVFVFCAGTNADAAVTTAEHWISVGVATSDGTQRCIIQNEVSSAADGAPLSCLLTNRVGGKINTSTGAMSFDLTAGGFTSSGFTLTPSASAVSRRAGYLALKFTGRRVKIVDFTTPTSTGSSTIPGAGFTPRAAIFFLTNLEATDPTFPISTSDLMACVAMGATADNSFAFTTGIDSGAATTACTTETDEVALMGSNASTSAVIKATRSAWTSDGVTLSYSAVQGTGKKGFVLFIE